MHLLSKTINFNKNKTESKMGNPTHSFRETNLQLTKESQIKSKTVMCWTLWKKKRSIFCIVNFVRRNFFLTFALYLNVLCLEYTFGIYILLQIWKHYFVHLFCLFLKSSKAFIVSLIWARLSWLSLQYSSI